MRIKLTSLLIMLCMVVGMRAAVTDTISIDSKCIVAPAKAVVIKPDAAADTLLRFPTVYILNGYDGDYASWINVTRPDLGDIADQYGMIFVMPDGRDSWYWNWPDNPQMQMESYIVDELVPYIDVNYPTRRDPSQRAITGLSMGGHGALYLAIRHNDIWLNAGSMSGGVDIRPFPNSWGMKKAIGERDANPATWTEHTVMGLVDQLKQQHLNITFDCGVDDFFAQVNRDLHQALLDAKIPHDYTERPGKHSHKYWANSILYHILFFNEAFNQHR